MSGTISDETSPTTTRVVARNRRRVLDRVRAHIERAGTADLSMREIAVVADVSPRTLYNLFGDRQGLLRALVERTLDEVDLAIEVIDAADPIDRIRATVGAAIDAVVGSLPAVVLPHILSDVELRWELAQRWRVGDRLVAEIGAAQRDGQLLDDIAPARLVDQIGVGLLHLLGGWSTGAVDGHQLRAGSLHTVDLALLAICPPDLRPRLRSHAMQQITALPDVHQRPAP